MRPRLQTVPSRDREFGGYARAAWEALGDDRTVEGLQHLLRRRYPAAIVRLQHELARHPEDPVVWYAHRMGPTAEPGTPASPPPDDWPAWAVLDDERRFLAVSPELVAIAEVPAETMLGRPVEAFSNPADPTIREDIGRLWREFLRTRELSSTIRFNFRSGRDRELAYQVRADADGPGRHRLSVRELRR